MSAITLTAYAARRGCSVKSVSRAVATGRLVQCVGRDERNRPTILDADLADREWEANTRVRIEYSAPNRPGAPAAAPPDDPPAAAPPAQRAARGQPAAADQPREMGEYYAHRAAREASESRRAAAQAELAELELAARRGQLIDVDQARADVIAAFSLAKTRLLALPSALGQRVPDIADRVVPEVDALLREALEELSARGGDRSAR